MKRLIFILTIMTAVLGFAFAAHAIDIDGGSFPVTATVVPTCEVTTTGINFGDYGGLAVEAEGSVDVTCIMDLSYQVGLDVGMYGDQLGRQMSDGDNFLPYAIFQDDVLSEQWGDSCVSSPTFGSELCAGSFAGTGTANNLTTWGQIPANQQVPVGDYSDVVVVTIVY